MRSVQKKVTFSKGQIAPELVERTDLELYNKSAQEIKNLVSTVYGGVRTRRGTKYVSDIYSSTTTGTVTNNIGGTDSYIQDFDHTFESSDISTTRDLITIDYGSSIVGAKVTVKNIKADFLKLINATSSTTFTVPSGVDLVHVDCAGSKGYGSSGVAGKGGRVQCDLPVEEGQVLNLTVGSIPSVVNTAVYNASDVRFGGNDYSDRIIVAGGGGAGMGNSWNASKGGDGGGLTGGNSGQASYQTLAYGGSQTSGGARSVWSGGDAYELYYGTNGTLGLGGNGGTRSGSGVGGAGGAGYYGGGGGGSVVISSVGATASGGGGGSSYTNSNCSNVVHTQGFQDGQGYVAIGLQNAKILIQKSSDGVTYVTAASYNIGTSPEDINVDLQDFRYVKLVLDAPAGLDLIGKLYFDYMRVNSNISSEVKLIPYIFNNEQEYVIALVKERIEIFKDGILNQEISASEIKENLIQEIKYTAKDDTIILTHKDMKPQELKRTNTGFVLSDFSFINTPVYAFGGETKTTKTTSITPSGLEGAIKITASSSIFDSTWVGNKIDGNGGIVRITEYVSGTVVNGVTIIPFYTTDAISSWTYISGYEPVWSSTRGYPRTCLFAQQRLWFGGSRDLPAHIWGSRLNDYNNFKNAGNYANDAIDATLLTNNPILNLVEQRGIHIFTSGEEWTASENNLTPDGFSVTKNTANGSQIITPVIIGGIVMYIEKNGKSLLGYVYNYEQASFVSDNISIFSNLIKSPVDMDAEINSNIDRGDFLFIVLNDGTMLTACVAVSERIFSISKFITDGNIKSVCCLTSDTYLAVDRGGGLYLEKLDDVNTDQTQTFYVNGQTISNLGEYNGKYIYIKHDDLSERVYVSDGQTTLPYSYTGYVTAGIGFDYKLQSNPIAIDNRTQTCKKRISKATLVTKNTDKLTFCGQTKKNDYTFYACTSYKDDVRFEITGEYNQIEVLSVTLNINYEG